MNIESNKSNTYWYFAFGVYIKGKKRKTFEQDEKEN